MKKAVFLRLDKIGDLIATLPVDQLPWLREKNVSVHWVIAKGLGWIVQNAEPQRSFFELDLRDIKKAQKDLIHHLREQKPDLVVVFYAPAWVTWACFRAGVPLRVGRKSQWHSFLFLNRGLRQKRSLAERHEADYNRELVEFAFSMPASESTPLLHLNPPVRRQLFEKFDLRPQSYFVVHPGMAGSALNWPQSHYNALIEKLVNAGPVVITGTPADDPYLTDIRPQWQHHPQVRWLQNQLSLEELLSLLKTARGVVAPSTGVLHLAAACGTPAVGIYSPVLAHSAQRWGPRGKNAIALTAKGYFPNPVQDETPEQALARAYRPRRNETPLDNSVMEDIKVNDVLKGLGL